METDDSKSNPENHETDTDPPEATVPLEQDWPKCQTQLSVGEDVLLLVADLGSQDPQVRRYLGKAGGRRLEVALAHTKEPLIARAERSAMLKGLALSPEPLAQSGQFYVQIVALNDCRSLAAALNQAMSDGTLEPPAQQVKRWLVPTVEAFVQLHSAGLFVGECNPAEVVVDGDGRAQFRWPPRCFRREGTNDLDQRWYTPGFAPPELLGFAGGRIEAQTDVFFLGVILYYFIAGISPLAETSSSRMRLPPPNLFSDHTPLDLSAVARRATSPIMSRRYSTVAAFKSALTTALDLDVLRRRAIPIPLQLDLGKEIHIGVLKGQLSPVNQDNLFSGYDSAQQLGLFVVSDGVSISRFGTGDLASECVRSESENLWKRLREPEHGDDTQSFSDALPDETLDANAAQFSRLPATFEGRTRLLGGMLDAANARIGEIVEPMLPRSNRRPEGIMAATALCCLLEQNRITYSFIGDSRIYLIRGESISVLTRDHNLKSQLVRAGRPPSQVEDIPGANALVRCVGDFDRNDDLSIRPVGLRPEYGEFTILPGDTVVMCSDGIVDYAGRDEEEAEEQIRKAVVEAAGAPWAAFELVVLANHGGGGDNISCIVLKFSAFTEMMGSRA